MAQMPYIGMRVEFIPHPGDPLYLRAYDDPRAAIVCGRKPIGDSDRWTVNVAIFDQVGNHHHRVGVELVDAGEDPPEGCSYVRPCGDGVGEAKRKK